ncbi:MAG: dethiobiotin synthase [Phenylobacterium sp.]
MTAIYIAGAHTDVGKTHVACAVIEAARGRGLAVDAFKPVASGFDPDDWGHSDPGRLLAALGRPHTQEALEAISPWRFAAPLAPPMAARLEARPLPLGPIAERCRRALAASSASLFVIEGVGGLMSPIAEAATGLDLMLELRLPTVLVGGSYLGALSHTLTAVEVIRARGLPLSSVVISQDAEAEAPDFAETVATIRGFCGGTRVIAAPRGLPESWPHAVLDAALSETT